METLPSPHVVMESNQYASTLDKSPKRKMACFSSAAIQVLEFQLWKMKGPKQSRKSPTKSRALWKWLQHWGQVRCLQQSSQISHTVWMSTLPSRHQTPVSVFSPMRSPTPRKQPCLGLLVIDKFTEQRTLVNFTGPCLWTYPFSLGPWRDSHPFCFIYLSPISFKNETS